MALRGLTLDLPGHPLLSPPTVNVGRIAGGTAVNLTPDRCTAEIDVRFGPGIDPAEAVAQIAAVLPSPVTLRIIDFKPAVEERPERGLRVLLEQVQRRAVGEPLDEVDARRRVRRDTRDHVRRASEGRLDADDGVGVRRAEDRRGDLVGELVDDGVAVVRLQGARADLGHEHVRVLDAREDRPDGRRQPPEATADHDRMGSCVIIDTEHGTGGHV
ncbi:MAG: peptidase dimerization domain-containing protein [Ectothiorhodospira sp.]